MGETSKGKNVNKVVLKLHQRLTFYEIDALSCKALRNCFWEFCFVVTPRQRIINEQLNCQAVFHDDIKTVSTPESSKTVGDPVQSFYHTPPNLSCSKLRRKVL